MSDLPHPTEIDQTIALEWLRSSLDRGSVISRSVLTAVEEHGGHSYVLAPETADGARLANPNEGGVIGTRSAEEALPAVFDALIERGATCVVVEDEVRLRNDPNPSVDGLLKTAFVDDRVLHWAELGDDIEPAIQVLHHGSHGYPLNAFVMSAKGAELGFADGADVGPGMPDAIVRSLVAVIVAVYDAETFLIWEPS